MKKVIFIGAGNVATHLSLAFSKKGFEIVQIFSRTKTSAKTLAKLHSTDYTTDISALKNADLYVYALSDSALESIIGQVSNLQGIHVHTAGSVSIKIFENKFENYGVLYPLQTFSKDKNLDFSEVPLFIEGCTSEVTAELMATAKILSNFCFEADSKKRMKMHISAVFACNFTNYFYSIAQQLLENEQIPFEILKPLITETANKLNTLSPYDAQTGPARRNDQITIQKHLENIEDLKLKELYKELSNNITASYNK